MSMPMPVPVFQYLCPCACTLGRFPTVEIARLCVARHARARRDGVPARGDAAVADARLVHLELRATREAMAHGAHDARGASGTARAGGVPRRLHLFWRRGGAIFDAEVLGESAGGAGTHALRYLPSGVDVSSQRPKPEP